MRPINEHECAVAQLTASHVEVAAIMKIKPKRALALLYYARHLGKCVKSQRRVSNGNNGRGAHRAALWVPTPQVQTVAPR